MSISAADNMDRLFSSLTGLPEMATYPVAQWDPPFCGDMDMVIKANGDWYHEGARINRPAMVKLFSRLLKIVGEDYFLVTPVEKVRITVEDVPFIAVEMKVDNGIVSIRTNVDDVVSLGAHIKLRLAAQDGFCPYLLVRDGLEARFSRSLAQEFANFADIISDENGDWLRFQSGGHIFNLTCNPIAF